MAPDDSAPIYPLRHLAQRLGTDKETLEELADSSDNLYRRFFQKKKSGGQREINEPVGKLKAVQKRIYERLLQIVQLDPHLHGGVKGCSNVTNAEPHQNKQVVICIDIKDFFPSVTAKKVEKVWRRRLGYGKKVSRVLTQLTTYKDRLPQGAPTSTALANLALFDVEGELRKQLAQHQITMIDHTRFVDDITFSGDSGDEEKLIATTIALLKRYGFALNRKKIKVQRSGGRQVVCGVVVNEDQPSLEKEKTSKVRAAVRELETATPEKQRALLPSVEGQVAWVKQFKPRQGKCLHDRISRVKRNLELRSR